MDSLGAGQQHPRFILRKVDPYLSELSDQRARLGQASGHASPVPPLRLVIAAARHLLADYDP